MNHKYAIGQKVHSPALGRDPPFDGLIVELTSTGYIIFDELRSKRWTRLENQISSI